MRLEITHDEIDLAADGFTSPEKPFSLIMLADLHNASYERLGIQIVDAVNEIKPKAIVSVGDLVTAKHGKYGIDQAVDLLHRLARCCPLYLVSGNHELRMEENAKRYPGIYTAYLRQIQSKRIMLLDNRRVSLTIHGTRLDLIGLNVPLSSYERMHRHELTVQEIRQLVGPAKSDVYQILIAHHPDFFPVYQAWGADLVLSGHVHGGIIRLPGLGGIAGTTIKPFPKYTKGMYQCDHSRMLLSAGLGMHTIPIRINNPPHLVVVEFR